MVHTRRCERCSVALSPWQRSDAQFCSGSCRVASHRARHSDDSASVLPSALRDRARWVRHIAKRPVTVTGHAASVTNPRTWSTFAAASAASDVGDGLGFVLNGDDGIACIDIDHCIGDDGLAPWAADLLARLPRTYIELSPSGRGVHVWGLATLPKGRVAKVDCGRIEVYGSGRYMTVTGQRFEGAPSLLADLSALIAQVTHH